MSHCVEYFVSIAGSDSWDGTSEHHESNTDTGPWKTLTHAIDALRQLRPNPPTADSHVTLILLPGTHYVTSKIAMNQRDSHITIKSSNDEEVSISGGLVLDGEWSVVGEIKSRTFQGSCGEAFAGSQRLVPARSPNLANINASVNVAHPPYNTIKDLLVETGTCVRDATAFSQNCPDENKMGFVFNDEFSSGWSHLDQTKVLVFHSWIAEYASVANIVEDNGELRVFFQEALRHAPIGKFAGSGDWRYIIFNNLALLDTPGEFVCIANGDGTSEFSYIPPTGHESTPVVVSQLKTLIDMNKVTDLKLEGIVFKHTSSGGVDGWNWGSESAMRMVSSKNAVISDCKFSQTGMIGLYITDSINIEIAKSAFTDIGYHGILIHYKQSNHEVEGMKDITIHNNKFNGCGVNSFWQPACIWFGGYSNMTVSNNEFTRTSYMPIRIKGLMPHGSQYWANSGVTEPTRDDYIYHVEFNHIYEYGEGILSDFGGIYMGK